MLVVGDREAATGTLSVRHRAEGDLGSFTLDDFISRIVREINTKSR
jgi:threonyl-tRNA synthetase